MKSNNYGKLITFEGGEGAGKTTQINYLTSKLKNKLFKKIISTREPGGTEEGEKIRSILVESSKKSINPNTELMLICAARYEHINKVIIPALNKGIWVCCDRFIDSTIAYQGYGHQLGVDIVNKINNIFFLKCIPDLTFIFDIDPSKGINRTKKRENCEDRFENMDISFHERVRKGFLDIANNNSKRCYIIDAELSIDDIEEKIWNIILDKFGD
ncbi:dTMP kinase [Alphaproteobacteria bacterium]|nr:dTMP kinase [Alphaproteobacteria bacterium]